MKLYHNGKPLINELQLETSAAIGDLKTFYENIIGLPVINETQNAITVLAGMTAITFMKSRDVERSPFYHFAFNIPENKIKLAFAWQKQRTPLINPFAGNPTDPMKDLIEFPAWNAQSVFFLDPAGNFVEYIARHDLKNGTEGAFSVADILYASEIGLIVEDVKTSGDVIMSELNIKEYHAAAPAFWPIGNEYGLIIMFQKGRIWNGRDNKQTSTDIFPTRLKVDCGQTANLKLQDYPYEIEAS